MRISDANTAPRLERYAYSLQRRIRYYGKGNDYPQKILDIVGSSGTGFNCMDIYVSFVVGANFADQAFRETVVNERGERAESLLRKAGRDLKYFNGFAILVKFDAFGSPAGWYNIPFEQCRLEIDSKGNYTNRVAIHPDWTGIYGQPFKNRDIIYIDRFDRSLLIQQIAEAGGPQDFLGQVYYFTSDGDWEYPVAPFDPIITDMLTEESVSTVKHRNAKFNFLPAGILVRKGIRPKIKPDGTVDENDPVTVENRESADMFKKMQGDMNTSKIWTVDVDADEEKPEFIEFTGKNYDAQFKVTETTVQENIGRAFKIPPILRGIDVGAGFGADLMKNAYDFMNSVTGSERQALQIVFKDLFQDAGFTNFQINPLTYVVP